MSSLLGNRSKLMATAMAAGLCFTVPAFSDVVTLKDGRVFEGTILMDDVRGVEIDTVVATIRTQLKFAAEEVASTQESELAPDFYDPPRGEVSTEDPSQFAAGSDLYIEVPVVGVIGKDVVATGIRKALAYAQRNRIEHVVFRVDSDGGSLDEMQSIVRAMKAYQGKVEMHALVVRCLGDALAVPMFCDSVTLLPSAVVGGSDEPLADAEAADENLDLEHTLRADLARKASAVAQSKGRPGTLIRACIDPDEQVAAWEDESGEVVLGRTLPSGIPAKNVIVENGEGELLVLDGPTLERLGAPVMDTDVAGLGETLGLDQWVPESEYGLKVMAKTAEHHTVEVNDDHDKSDKAIARNIERRAAADATLKQSISQAQEWDPAEHSYATYESSGGRRRWSGDSTDSRDTNRLTSQSQAEWTQRSDAAMRYLSQAAKAARSLKKLDEEAVKLGLEPTYGPGELDTIIQDLTVKYDFLSANRNKKSK